MSSHKIHGTCYLGRSLKVRMPKWTQHAIRQFCRFTANEQGQDLLEYALLTGAIGLVGVVAWQAIQGGIGTAYTGWDSGVQDLWEPDDPQ